MRYFVFLTIPACLMAWAINGMAVEEMKIGEKKIIVEVSGTPEEVVKGLRGRLDIFGNRGMLFAFPFKHNWCFNMTGCPNPLDILFIDQGEVIGIESGAPEEKDIRIHQGSSFVVEVEHGWCKKNEIEVGSKVTLPEGVEDHIQGWNPRHEEATWSPKLLGWSAAIMLSMMVVTLFRSR